MNAIEKMWTYINTHDQGEIDRPELYSMWNAVVYHVATEHAALERKLEAAQRTITAQKERIAELEAESDEAWPNSFLLSGDELDRAERQLRTR